MTHDRIRPQHPPVRGVRVIRCRFVTPVRFPSLSPLPVARSHRRGTPGTIGSTAANAFRGCAAARPLSGRLQRRVPAAICRRARRSHRVQTLSLSLSLCTLVSSSSVFLISLLLLYPKVPRVQYPRSKKSTCRINIFTSK